MSAAVKRIARPSWGLTLTAAQRATVLAIRTRCGGSSVRGGSEGWRVLMTPSVGPARYVELRHYLTGGGLARWVIERDGSVSATNGEGRWPELRPVERTVA